MASPFVEQSQISARSERAQPADPLSPQPILSAVENYRGAMVDLDRGRAVDAAELGRMRSTLLGLLRAEGIRDGERVLVAIGNGPLFVAALDSLLRVGACPLLVHDQLPPAELKRTALRYGVSHVLSDGHELASLAALSARQVEGDVSGYRYVQSSLDPSEPGFSFDFPTLHGVPLHPTSGTTGMSKIAARPGPSAVAEAVNYLGATEVDRRDTLLVVTPMSHAYAYGMGMMVPLLSGARIVSMRKFGLQKVLDALANHGVTVFPAVPAILDMLLFGRGGNLLSGPRMVLSAGAPLTRRTAENFRKVTGRLIHPLYGTTETGGISVGVDGVFPEEADCVGPPLSGVEARLDDSAAGGADDSLPRRIAIRSTSMMAGYLGPSGIDRSPLREGWFLTGDLARIDSEGGVHLRGRESDVINAGGMKVVPSEVEEVLARFPGVLECKVYGGERRPGQQFVKAVVVGSESLDLAQLREYCQEQLVYYKRPAAIVRLDAMPRSSAGKILKDQLP